MAKATVEGLRFIDVQDWHRRGLLKSRKWFFCSWQSNRVKSGLFVGVESQRVVLFHLIRGPGRKYQRFIEPVYLDFSPCHYGGERPWFLCPSCNRRAWFYTSADTLAAAAAIDWPIRVSK